jgi:hypothetical protein
LNKSISNVHNSVDNCGENGAVAAARFTATTILHGATKKGHGRLNRVLLEGVRGAD